MLKLTDYEDSTVSFAVTMHDGTIGKTTIPVADDAWTMEELYEDIRGFDGRSVVKNELAHVGADGKNAKRKQTVANKTLAVEFGEYNGYSAPESAPKSGRKSKSKKTRGNPRPSDTADSTETGSANRVSEALASVNGNGQAH